MIMLLMENGGIVSKIIGHSLIKTALIENGDKKTGALYALLRVFKNDAKEPLFYVLDYDKDKSIIKTLNASILNEKRKRYGLS